MVQADLRAVLPQLDVQQGLSLFIGPEGGWSKSEAGLFEQSNFELVSLGPRILKTETAVISVLSLLGYFC